MTVSTPDIKCHRMLARAPGLVLGHGSSGDQSWWGRQEAEVAADSDSPEDSRQHPLIHLSPNQEPPEATLPITIETSAVWTTPLFIKRMNR